jgi:hypothetical protein
MPWTVADVDKHKKGLTPAQKKEWVKVANGVLADCNKSGGSDCEGKAIRVANSKFTDDNVVLSNIPATAFVLGAEECFATIDAKEGAPARLKMVAYSGKIIKNHWWWGDLAIDLQGMNFPKRVYPILDSHDPSKKIAFMKKPVITADHVLTVEPDSVTFVDTPAAQEFVKLSKQGFPYEASIHAMPQQIQRLSPEEVADVNGFSMKGPGTIWRKSTFKEASVCMFGYDPNTQSVAMEKPLAMSFNNTSGLVNFGTTEGNSAGTVISTGDSGTWADFVFSPQVFTTSDGGDETMPITIEQFKKDAPDEYGKLVNEITQQVKDEMAAAFAKEKADLETKFTDEVKTLRESVEASDKRILQFEKTEEIRREGERRGQAESIFRDALSKSNIPDYLHAKVIRQIDYAQFVAEGVLDVAKFTEAVTNEIKDWEGSGAFTQPRVQGHGTTLRVVTPPDKDAEFAKKDDESVEELLAMVGQAPKK